MSRSLTADPWLVPYREKFRQRGRHTDAMERRLTGGAPLAEFASAHHYFGLHRTETGWVFREWAPNAESIYLIGTFSDWLPSDSFRLKRLNPAGHWEIALAGECLAHGDLYRLHVAWPGGAGDRIPAYARRVVQDPQTLIFNAQVWAPPEPHAWEFNGPQSSFEPPLIYEAHIGMAQEKEGIGTYDEFRTKVLPLIHDGGYNTLQLMAIMEHPYYASFGYHVSSFFAVSSRFGTPEEFKRLVDAAHGLGIRVIIDLIHSHAVCNEVEGLSRFDGTDHQYFHGGARGWHPAWESRCFDYGKPEVLHFLLSNCRDRKSGV